MRRHLLILATAIVAMSAIVAAGGGIPPVKKMPAAWVKVGLGEVISPHQMPAGIPTDVPGEFATSWSWMKELAARRA